MIIQLVMQQTNPQIKKAPPLRASLVVALLQLVIQLENPRLTVRLLHCIAIPLGMQCNATRNNLQHNGATSKYYCVKLLDVI